MTTTAHHGYSLPFTVAMSFLLGIVTTIAVYSLRNEPAASLRDQPAAQPVDIRAFEPEAAAAPAASTHPDSGTSPEPAERVPTAPVSPTEAGIVVALRARDLHMPVDDVDRKDLHNTFSDARGTRTHEALDIIAPRGTKVMAVEDGRIEKLFTSKAGGLTIYQFDPTDTFAYYYAHLDRYADGLRDGQSVHRGDVIGFVGSTGNASPDTPHLHFAIFRLTPERQWWKGEAINPYPILREP